MKIELCCIAGFYKIYFVNDSKYVVTNGNIQRDNKGGYLKRNVIFESERIQDVLDFFNHREDKKKMAKYGYTLRNYDQFFESVIFTDKKECMRDLRDFIYSVGKHNVKDVYIQAYFKNGTVKNKEVVIK